MSARFRFGPAVLLLLFSFAAAISWIFQVDPGICNGCGTCLPHCPTGALSMTGPDAWIDPDLCDGCGDCVPFCIRGAIYRYWYQGIEGTETPGVPSVSPNPATGSFLVTGCEPGSLVRVMDLTGRTVWSGAAGGDGELLVDMDTDPPGVYLVTTDTGILAVTLRTQRM